MLVVFVRTLILYLIVIIIMRIMGKRQIGQLQIFELAIAIMISDLAAVPMQNTGIPLINGIIPILTLLICQILISLISLKSTKARTIICGTPSILIKNGKISEDSMQGELYNLNDLLEQLRIKDMPNIADCEFAILENNGQLSVIPKSQKKTLTPSDLKLDTIYEGLSLPLIIDGKVIDKSLKISKLDKEWLSSELLKFKINTFDEILFASLDTEGKLFFQRKENIN